MLVCGPQEQKRGHPHEGFAWIREYAGTDWPCCPAWYVEHIDMETTAIVERVDRIVGLADAGISPGQLTDAGEAMVILARRYRERVEAEERARMTREQAKKRKQGVRP